MKRGILVIHPGAIGDVLLARPVLFHIRCLYPEHELVLLAASAVGGLLQESAEIDRALSLESTYLTELLAGGDHLHPAFKDWLRRCDLVVGWLRDPEGAVSATLQDQGVGHIHIQSPSSPDLLSTHQTARYLEVLEGKCVSEVKIHPLILSSRVRDRGRQLLHRLRWRDTQHLVVIHAGSGSMQKCMKAEQVAPVIEWLYRKGRFPILLQGPSDAEIVHRVQRLLETAVPVLRDAELMTVAGSISHADLYIGHDSGVTHLAAALSIPTIACFGPTNPLQWAPLGTSVTIVTGDTCRCPDWITVMRCQEQTCLRIPPERIVQVCRNYC
jgi:ADP-heptose:LPS heptosyltransferase